MSARDAAGSRRSHGPEDRSLHGADRLRELPSVDQLAGSLIAAGDAVTPAEAVSAARAALEHRRCELLDGRPGSEDLLALARARLEPSLRRVLNATGVVVHTNLGRAPLAESAAAAVARSARGYANLELDLVSGRRGSRDEHVRGLLRELTGAEDALAVNNGAGAALLALAALAGDGRAVAISRGQLVEIGGGFRVPDVLAQAGAAIVEVGTTNRTRPADYERAIAEQGAELILRVHQSNFRTVGFVQEVPIEELCRLGVPVIDDIGSGSLAEGLEQAADEPPVRRSLAAGAQLVCFSGDKLLGGPQAGILVGAARAVSRARAHPLARALRIGRLPLAALEATLALYRDPERALREIPVLAMLTAPAAELEARARRLADATGGEVVEAVARIGGGALPLLELPGAAVALSPAGWTAHELAAALRAGEPPLIARIAGERVILDPRTLAGEEELDLAGAAVGAALATRG
jgi:L-seryl-tRNA(Ser) seleniumtransferase